MSLKILTYIVLIALTASVFNIAAGAEEPLTPRNDVSIDYTAFTCANISLPLKSLISEAARCIEAEQYDSAAAFYSVAISRFSDDIPLADKRRCAIANVNLGYIWLARKMNAAEAYPLLMRAREIASEYGFNDIETSVISNLGQIYFDYNNIDKAVSLYHTALLRVMEEKGDRYFGRALLDFAAAALFDNRIDLLSEMVAKSASYKLAPDAPLRDYSAAVNRALRLVADSCFSQAAGIMVEATPLFDVSSDRKRYLALHYLITAQCMMLANDLDGARRQLHKMIDISVSEGYFNLMEKGYADLEECAEREGDRNAMAAFRNRSMLIRDSLFSAARFETVKDLETAGRLRTLHEDLLTAARETEMQRRQMIWISLSSGLLLIILVILFISHRRLKNAYYEIFKRNMELSEQRLPSSEPTTTCDGETTSKTSPDEVSEENGKIVLAKVTDVLESNHEIFNPDFSVDRMAAIVDEKPKTVSQAINTVAGKNFNALLSEYRIREACRILANPESLRTSTMESVAEMVGYRSRTHFSKIFKDITGLTPTQFVKQAKNDFEKV